MPVGRYFRGLTAYDLLGNIVPGVIALLATIGFHPSPPIPDNLGEYGLFTIFAFSIGAIIQAYASKAVGERKSFDKTMGSVESLPSLQYSDNSEDEQNDEDEADEGANQQAWRVLHPFIGPVCGWWRPPRGKQLDDVILANRIWGHLVDTYEIPFRTESYSVLYHVMSSKVDDISAPSRATRIQAIRNFHRGMWITAWYSLVLIIIAMITNTCLQPGDPVLGVEYASPAYFEYWTPVWHLAVIAAVGVVIFWLLFESTEEDYIEYLFADYAVSIGNQNRTVALADETELEISGTVNTQLETESPITHEERDSQTDGENGAETD